MQVCGGTCCLQLPRAFATFFLNEEEESVLTVVLPLQFATVVGALASRPKFVVGRLHVFIAGDDYVHCGREHCGRKEVCVGGELLVLGRKSLGMGGPASPIFGTPRSGDIRGDLSAVALLHGDN